VSAPVTDTPRLRAARERLLAAKRARQFGPVEAEALAECNFRLALLPGASVLDSLGLLREAVRLDGANPKYAYHLARIYFAHGDFAAASMWLREAVGLCPTSHRLWAHVGLLQRELNATHFGDERYEPDALRALAERVEEAIATGSDALEPALLSFTPPTSKAELEKQARQTGRSEAAPQEQVELPPAFRPMKRLTRAGACRWSGIHDLRVEHLLQAKATKRGLGRLVPLLERAAEAAPKRAGGAGGFCVLGVLWVVSGYPAATVRRLAPIACGASDTSGPAARLLAAVCDVYEAPPAEVPARLAAALSAGALPPVLAAVIHRRRVLNRPLEFRAMTALRAGRRLLADLQHGTGAAPSDKDATEVARRLLSAAEALYPPPPDELKDEPPAAKKVERDPPVLLAEFEALRAAAVVLEKARDDGFVFLKGDLTPRAQTPDALALADRDALGELVKELKAAGTQGDARVEAVVQELAKHAGAAPADFQNQRDECQKQFRGLQSLGNFEKVFRRLDAPFAAARETTAPVGAPTPALAELLAQVRGALPPEAAAGAAPAADDPASAVAALGTEADALAATLDADWARVRALAAIHKKNDPPLSAAERDEAVAIRARVEAAFARSKELLERVAGLRAGGAVPPEAIAQLDDAEKRLLALGERNGPFRRNFTALQLPEVTANAPAAPSGAPAQAPGAFPAVQLADRPLPPPVERTGFAGLAAVLAHTEREIARAFDAAEATFAPYSTADMSTPGFAALRWTVLARKAETLYRLGRRSEARRAWSRLYRLDPLDAGVRRNLAVCDTALGEPLRALDAWKGYTELLYFYDAVTDDPRAHAKTRGDLHRALAHAYAPPAVFQKSDDWLEKFDPVTVIGFLGTPAGVRNFVGHKLLEYLNGMLEALSPPVIVGVGRSDPPAARARAMGRWDEFRGKFAERLPERVRAAFTGIVRRHVAKADEEGSGAKLAQRKDATYGDDRKRLLDLVMSFAQAKFRLGLLLLKSNDSAGQLGTFEGLVELLRFDDVPLDANAELFEAAARKLGQEPDELRKALRELAAQFVLGALRFVIDVPTDDADRARRCDLFRKLATQIAPHPAMESAVPLIDGPYRSPQLTLKWLPDDAPETEIPVLRRWHESFPQMAGVAFRLAQVLLRLSHGGGDSAALEFEAVSALEIGAKEGFYAPSVEVCIRQLIALRQGQGKVADALKLAEQYRDASTNEVNRKVLARMCLQLRFQAELEEEHFERALDIGVALLADDDGDFEHAQNLLKAFELAAKRLRRDPGRAAVSAAIDGWAARAQTRWDRQGGDELKDEGAVTPATIDRLKAARDESLVQAVVAAHSDATGTCDDSAALAAALTDLIDEFPKLSGAYFRRMMAYAALADDASDDATRADAKRRARADGQEVLTRTTDPQQQTAAKEVLEDAAE